MKSLALETVSRLYGSWQKLFFCDLLFKALTFILLVPLLSVLLHLTISFSGDSILADFDLILIFFRPIGLVCLLVLLSLWVAILALKISALMAVSRIDDGIFADVRDALGFSLVNIWRIFHLVTRLVGYSIAVTMPFLVVAGLTYLSLLTEFDINYYIKEKPPVFWLAITIGFLLGLALVTILLHLFAGWIFALPILLFEDDSPKEAIRKSYTRAIGQRWRIVSALIGAMLIVLCLEAGGTSLTIGLGHLLIPPVVESMTTLTLTIGGLMVLWFGISLVINIFATTLFVSVVMALYFRSRPENPDSNVPTTLKVGMFRRGYAITPMRMIFGFVIGFLTSSLAGFLFLNSVPTEDDVVIISHRGASQSAPENTMSAIKLAIEEKADFVEIDVQETADGEVVVFHDSDFMKLAGKNLKIWNATQADLSEIDIGSWFDPKFREERVPTLSAVLKECKGKIGVAIELKYYGHDKNLEKRVVDIVEEEGMANDVMLMSLKADAVKKLKQLRPKWTIGLLLSVYAGNLTRLDADFLAVNAAFVDRAAIRRAHRAKMKIFVWTVNDAVSMSAMLSRRVDGIITDRPELAQRVLAEREQLSLPERLLHELAIVFGVSPEIAAQ